MNQFMTMVAAQAEVIEGFVRDLSEDEEEEIERKSNGLEEYLLEEQV